MFFDIRLLCTGFWIRQSMRRIRPAWMSWELNGDEEHNVV
jgi:hypothetical protein